MINKNSILNIKVTSKFEESTVSKILNLIENAGNKKSHTENFITKFARYYTPAVVFIAAAIAIIPSIFIEGANFNDWLYRGLVFLVVSCPCALVISIPLGFFGGIGGAAKEGILFKGSNYLEALNNVEKIVFDKTGTLTEGKFKVVKVENLSEFNDNEFMKYIAFTEYYSNHPISNSVVEFYGNKIEKEIIENFEEISGFGVKATINSRKILAGNSKFMRMENVILAGNVMNDKGTVIYTAIDGVYAGYIVISDMIKKDSLEAIKALNNMGIDDIVMLTGDSKYIGESVSKDIGIKKSICELLPHEKVEEIEKMEKNKSEKGKVVFVGDGINDGPSLARADIGIAMGGLGSDVAIEAADVVIMTDEPSKIPLAIKFANRTRKIVWQNIIFAFAVKGIVLLLGANGIATMWEAVFADVGVAIIAIFNSMRVLNFK
jgi:Cd2+/Zn2+-exporting ATPase